MIEPCPLTLFRATKQGPVWTPATCNQQPKRCSHVATCDFTAATAIASETASFPKRGYSAVNRNGGRNKNNGHGLNPCPSFQQLKP